MTATDPTRIAVDLVAKAREADPYVDSPTLAAALAGAGLTIIDWRIRDGGAAEWAWADPGEPWVVRTDNDDDLADAVRAVDGHLAECYSGWLDNTACDPTARADDRWLDDEWRIVDETTGRNLTDWRTVRESIGGDL